MAKIHCSVKCNLSFQFIAADNAITPEEFDLMAPKIIFSCAPDAADGDAPEELTPDGNAYETTNA